MRAEAPDFVSEHESVAAVAPDELGFCPFDDPESDNMCWYCTGKACAICEVHGYPDGGCQHDVMDRHPDERD